RGGFIKTNSPLNHALTVYQESETGQDVAVALNVISNNKESSAMYLSGKELNRGTLKITHTGDGTDSAAAALSVDLVGEGTAAQAIFINSSNDREEGELGTVGNVIVVRNTKGEDDFKLSANGRISMGGAVGYNPTAMLDLRIPNTTTPGVALRAARPTGDNLPEVQRSPDGAVRTRLTPPRQLVPLATAHAAGPGLPVGGPSGAFGRGSRALGLSNATVVPSYNPAR